MAKIDDATFDLILQDVAAGEALRDAIKQHGSNNKAFYAHIGGNEEASERYWQAKQAAMHVYADRAMAIADECEPTRDAVAKGRLQIDVIKWALAHLAPKKYSERTVIAGDADNPLSFELDPKASLLRGIAPRTADDGEGGASSGAQ